MKDGEWSDEMDRSQHSSEVALPLPLSVHEEEEEDDESQLVNIALGLPWMLSRSQDASPQFPSIRPDRPIDPTRLSLLLLDVDQALRRLEADIGQDDPSLTRRQMAKHHHLPKYSIARGLLDVSLQVGSIGHSRPHTFLETVWA